MSPFPAAPSTVSIWHIVSALAVGGVELGLGAVVIAAMYVSATAVIRRVAAIRGGADESTRAFQSRTRVVLVLAALAIAAAVVGYNGWLVVRGVDVKDYTLARLAAISAQVWLEIAITLAKLTAAAIGLMVVLRIFRIALSYAEAWLNRWDRLRDNDGSLATLVAGINRTVAITCWMLLAVLAFRELSAPHFVVDGLLRAIRVYVVVAIGILIIRASVTIVDTLEGLSHRYSQQRGWIHYYEHLRSLVPTFRACLEYGLWVGVGSLVLLQVGAGGFAVWGAAVIQAIGILFLSRVVIQLGRFEIGRRLLPPQGLDEMTRRRRETIAPLLRTAFTYAVYFSAAVLILASLGFNPVPFLAGAGILGLVVGFGAQSLINDVVSGFFILFENTYIVGDSIEVMHAKGVVEEIEFRTTKIRDSNGRVHIIRNGDVKQVVNYSKDYTYAVVPVDVDYSADWQAVCSVLREASERVRATSGDVTGETQIDGIVAFGKSAMTVRMTTRVKPGRHEAAAAELRLAIKEAFDRQADSTGRRGLVPPGFASRPVLGPRDHHDRVAGAAPKHVGAVSIRRR